jgi:hypothetical protein
MLNKERNRGHNIHYTIVVFVLTISMVVDSLGDFDLPTGKWINFLVCLPYKGSFDMDLRHYSPRNGVAVPSRYPQEGHLLNCIKSLFFSSNLSLIMLNIIFSLCVLFFFPF